MRNNVDNPFKSPAVLSLCPGMLGLERGLERAIGSIRTVAYVEIEAFIIENLVQQMEQGVLAPAPVWSDVKTFQQFAHLFRGKIHGITGGYPCQPFSVAGRRRGTEDPRHLWPYIKEIIRSTRPVWCFFENVPGHLELGYREVRSDMESIGYKVEEGIFSASEVGAPHQRKRLFILAIRKDFLAHAIGAGVWSECRSTGRGTREQDVRQRNGAQCTVRIESTGKLADTDSERFDETRSSEIRFNIEGELANADDNGERSRQEQTDGSSELGVGSQLANSNSSGLGQLERQFTDEQEQPSTECDCPNDRWPTGPGEEQHEWEPPRVESSMGYVLNGYNFREDLLRMAGNAVVEQTAELAFRTLIGKFL